MLLSEAIRLGAMLRPQGRGNNSILTASPRSCAIGAALQAIGEKVTSMNGYAVFRERWALANEVSGCPECSCRYDGLVNTIFHLNDMHDWTRERISDWVEQQERERGLIPAPVAEEAEVVHLSRGA